MRAGGEGTRGRVMPALRSAARTIVLVACVALVAGCAQQRIRDTAQAQLRAGDYEQSLKGLEAGLQTYPESAVLRAGLIEIRLEVQTRLIREATLARSEGRLDEAEKALQRASTVQAGNARVQSLLTEIAVERRQRSALAEAEALVAQRKPTAALVVITDALKANPRQPDLVALQRKLEYTQRQTQIKSSQTTLAETRPISLDFRDANLKTVLDVLSRNSGVNFILDKDIRPDARVTVFLRSAKVEDAIDLITSTNQLAKKIIDSQTLLIYPNTPEKRLEHQEQVVRVFYLASGDAKGAAAFLKSMLKLRDPYVDERTNMLALRDSQENVQLAERLIGLYDTPEPEVLLEVEVIEIFTSRLTDLGVKLPDSFSLNVLPPAGEDGLTLANVRGLTRDRIGLSIGGVTVNLKRETGDFNTLANPRIRVKNKEKARILVGDKVPVVSATTGQSGFVSDSISYLDVGLKVDVEPTVYVDDEVAIKVGLEVSSLGAPVKTASGSLAYQIGTRNATTMLRLRDGETQLLAGLISAQDRSDASRVPGLGDLPVMGRVFSSTRDDNQRTELVLSITPRILRNQRRPDVTEAEMWVGTDTSPRVRPIGGGVRVASADDGVARPTAAAPLRSDGPQPGSRAVGMNTAPPPVGTQAAPTAGAAVNVAAAATTGPTTAHWVGPAQAKTGETFSVALELQVGQPLRGAPAQIEYAKDLLELVSIEEGDLLKQGGVATNFTHSIDAASGRANAAVLRSQPSGVSGRGKFVTLTFKARAPGTAQVRATGIEPIGTAGTLAPIATLPTLSIQIQ